MFSKTGLDGGGFQSVVAVDGRGTVLVGADVSGIHRSVDNGVHFVTANRGLSTSGFKVASLLFDPRQVGKAYAATGVEGQTGGLFVSIDGGSTWSLRSSEPKFSGNNNKGVGSLPAPHPRSTGNLIALDPASGALWVATFQDGVWRSDDDGGTWVRLGLSGKFLRSLAFDPDNPDVLYAATYGEGVWKTTAARGAGRFEQLARSPQVTEELALVADVLHAAGGLDGIHLSKDGGTTWEAASAGLPANDGTVWTAIAGYQRDKTVVLFAAGMTTRGDRGVGVYRSDDGGAAWSSFDPEAVHDTVLGTDEAWWLSRANPSFLLGRSDYVAAQIVIDPSNPETVFVAGRSGIWRSTNGGREWYPAVNGLAVTATDRVVVDVNNQHRVYVANTDYRLIYSEDGMAHVAKARPPEQSPTAGLDVTLDTARTPSVVYLALGERDTNTDGEIYSSTDPAANQAWVSEGLAKETGGKRPLAIVARTFRGTRVLVAAVENGGIWRKAGDRWQQVSKDAMTARQTAPNASLVWPEGTETLYLYDRASGVWRSNDSGTSWVRIWDRKSNQRLDKTGFLAVDPGDTGRLYVSVGSDGVYRVDGDQREVNDGATAVKIGSFDAPGPLVAVAPGTVLVASLGDEHRDGRLDLTRDAGQTWTTVSDQVYAEAALNPSSIAVTDTGTVYVALANNGVMRSS